VKNLEKEEVLKIKNIAKDDVLLFLDLASASLDELNLFPNRIFILDHHEITGTPNSNITMINPHLFDNESISAAGISYLFSRAIDPKNKDLAGLAVIGMVGDMLDRNLSKSNNEILNDAEVTIKKGLMLYPATRPIHKALEYSSGIYIPGVTGNAQGAFELVREIGLTKEGNTFKSLIELDEDEMSKLLTAVLLRTKKTGNEIIGNIYLVKFFNKLEDARELSAMINACSRLGQSYVSLSFCIGSKTAIKNAEEIYAKYKQQIVSALNFVEQNKIEGKNYIIINAKDQIKDTIIGTISSIVSMSATKEEGSVVIGMAYDNEKIKVSARLVGRNGRNVRELLDKTVKEFGGEGGGHPQAAGCLICKDKEEAFLTNIVKNLELEVVKV